MLKIQHILNEAPYMTIRAILALAEAETFKAFDNSTEGQFIKDIYFTKDLNDKMSYVKLFITDLSKILKDPVFIDSLKSDIEWEMSDEMFPLALTPVGRIVYFVCLDIAHRIELLPRIIMNLIAKDTSFEEAAEFEEMLTSNFPGTFTDDKGKFIIPAAETKLTWDKLVKVRESIRCRGTRYNWAHVWHYLLPGGETIG